MTNTKTFQVEKQGKLTWVVIRQMPHDTQFTLGSRIPGLGKVVAIGDVFGNRLPIEQENMSTEANPDPYQIEHTVIGRKMLGR